MTTSEKRVLIPVSHPLGGIRTYMLYNLQPICEQGYRFTFLSKEGSAFSSFQEDVAQWPGVDFVTVPRNGFYWKSIHSELKTKCYSLVHSQGLRAGTETEIANYFMRVPHLITLHDVINPYNQIPGKFKSFKKWVIGFFSRRASTIIPVSNDCSEIYQSNFPAWKKGPCKIQVIANGIHVERLIESRRCFQESNAKRLRDEYGLASNVVIGGFFGRFMPEKGIQVLVAALSELARRGYQDHFRLFATKDNHGYRNETIRSVAENPDIASMVRFIEPVTDIAPILSQINVLITPSLFEACPILPMEAMVLGIPVIGSDAVGLREVLKGTPSVAPPKENAIALADAIEQFIMNPFSEKAKSFETEAQKRFDIKIAADKLVSLYEKHIS